MTHIFYLHSNICSIVAFDTILQISQTERVVVITNRGCVFNVLRNRIEYYDATEKFDGYCNHLGSLLSAQTYKTFKSYKQYLKDVKVWLDAIIGGDDFILYTPNYAVEMCRMLARNKHCIHYLFIEEGTMAYLSIPRIKELSYDFKTHLGNIARFLFLGIRTCFQLKITSKFIGTIGLSKDAFLWNKDKKKIIVSGREYLKRISDGLSFYNNYIIISYASYDIEKTISAIEVAYNKILNDRRFDSIAVKLHPQSYFYYPNYAAELEQTIDQHFAGNLHILPVEYPIEAAIVLNRSYIYSIFVRSSLSLYSLVLSAQKTYLINPDMSMTDIPDLESYLA